MSALLTIAGVPALAYRVRIRFEFSRPRLTTPQVGRHGARTAQILLPWRRCLRAALTAGRSPPPGSFYNGLSGAGAGPFRGDAAASAKPIVQKREGSGPRLTACKWRIARPLPGALRPAVRCEIYEGIVIRNGQQRLGVRLR